MRGFQLVAINDRWGVIGEDKDAVTKPGQLVHLAGLSGRHPAWVVRHIADRKLVVVKHAGYSDYIGGFQQTAYMPARFVIYAYSEKPAGNEIHLYVDLFGIAEIPIKWKPEGAE